MYLLPGGRREPAKGAESRALAANDGSPGRIEPTGAARIRLTLFRYAPYNLVRSHPDQVSGLMTDKLGLPSVSLSPASWKLPAFLKSEGVQKDPND